MSDRLNSLKRKELINVKAKKQLNVILVKNINKHKNDPQNGR